MGAFIPLPHMPTHPTHTCTPFAPPPPPPPHTHQVREEARVVVDEVRVVGSQPWPIGRYGSCELMLGCIAKARSYEIFVNTREVRAGGGGGQGARVVGQGGRMAAEG